MRVRGEVLKKSAGSDTPIDEDSDCIVNTTSQLPSQIKSTWHEINTTWNIAAKMTRDDVRSFFVFFLIDFLSFFLTL